MIMGGSISFWGGAQGGALFLRIQSAPPQTGGEHKGEHFGKLGAAGENFRVLASDVDQKYTKFIKLRQIIMKLAPQAIFFRNWKQNFENYKCSPPNWGGAQGGAKF